MKKNDKFFNVIIITQDHQQALMESETNPQHAQDQ